MANNIFEMGADFGSGWVSDNKEKGGPTDQNEIKTPTQHQLYFTKEKRKAKVVTIVKPFYLTKDEMQTLVKLLKKKLATGGTAKENVLEFQGDVASMLSMHLKKMGYGLKS